MPPTQAEIVQGIVDEICDPYKVPYVAEPLAPVADPDDELDAAAQAEAAAREDLRLTMLLNLSVQPSRQMLEPEFCTMPEPHPSGWHCREGIVKNVQTIADEFCKERKLRAMRVLVAGPPASGKSTLARHISEHFRIPVHELPADNIEEMVETLAKRVCRYRGYVLDAGGCGFDGVDRLYRYKKMQAPQEPAEEAGANGGEEAAVEGAEDAEEKPPPQQQAEKGLIEDIVPSFVITTQAPAKVLEGLWIKANGTEPGSKDRFKVQMEEYLLANTSHRSLTDFFQEVAKVGIMNLPIVGRDEDELFESARIYMEQEGRPFNYLPTEEEAAKEVMEQRERKRKEQEATAEQERLAQSTGTALPEDQSKRHAERMRLIAEHEAAQQQLREMPLREYLMEFMIPNLTEGLIEVCKVLPENPADYLANYLEENASQAAPKS